MVSIIVAIDEKRGIGKHNDLLFRIPEDFQRMRSLTLEHPIIMGRKTFESIGRVLPKRTNIIITRDREYTVEGAVVVPSLEDAIKKAKESEGSDEIFIFGGGQIFKEAVEKGMVDKLYLTLVKGDYGADVFFPEYETQFPVIESEETKTEGEYTYTFQNRLKQRK